MELQKKNILPHKARHPCLRDTHSSGDTPTPSLPDTAKALLATHGIVI